MTPEQLDEIKKLLAVFWDGSIPYNPKLGVEIADRALPLVKALREAREDAHKHREDALAWMQVSYQNLREKQNAESDRAMLLSVLEGVAKHTGVSVESICEDPSVVARRAVLNGDKP